MLALCLMLSRSTLLIRLFFMAAVARGQPERLQTHGTDAVRLEAMTLRQKDSGKEATPTCGV